MSDAMPETAENAAELQTLDLELKDLIRRKYKQHWHRCVGRANSEPEGGLGEDDYAALKTEIRAVFDKIRLIDKKYKLPTLSMYE